MGPKCHYKCPCKREAERFDTHVEEVAMWRWSRESFEDAGLKNRVMQSQAKVCWYPPETGRGKHYIFSQSLWRESIALPTPRFWLSVTDFKLLASDCERKMSVVLSHPFVVFCYSSPRKLIQVWSYNKRKGVGMLKRCIEWSKLYKSRGIWNWGDKGRAGGNKALVCKVNEQDVVGDRTQDNWTDGKLWSKRWN